MVEIDAQKIISLSLSLLFYIKKSKADAAGKTNIYLRITLDGLRSEFSIHRKTHINWWNSKAQLAMGNSPEVQNINQHLSILRNKVYSIQQNFERENETYTATDIKDALIGKDKTQKILLEIFQEHNTEVENLIEKDFTAGTAERYRTCKKHVASFIKKKYQKNDIPVRNVDHITYNYLKHTYLIIFMNLIAKIKCIFWICANNSIQ